MMEPLQLSQTVMDGYSARILMGTFIDSIEHTTCPYIDRMRSSANNIEARALP